MADNRGGCPEGAIGCLGGVFMYFLSPMDLLVTHTFGTIVYVTEDIILVVTSIIGVRTGTYT
jgi:hypothetical protein